ncbi:TetR/AcrR family transcriptional regulator [Kribbella monticola]|uniref:TetR/AcrR family transcriptional regulator n=1 Tax=Kribbella monticola TaxID=2185285 RepID=UPI000DD3A436|nr:TetR family transcriptional regulator [Kribbella monticola]
MNKSRGRPRGNPDTKARIAEVAYDLFLKHGYRGTTVRRVAAAAEVDSALISYHFGSKQGLFGEAMQFRCGKSPAMALAMQGDQAGFADRLLEAVLEMWADTEPLAELTRMAPQDADVLAVLQEFLEREILGRIAEFLRGPDATDRATAAVAVIGGLIFTRYLNPLRPAAALSDADVRRILAPALRAALNPTRTRRPLSA